MTGGAKAEDQDKGGRGCGLVVDSGATLGDGLQAGPTVVAVPLRVEVGGRLLRDGVDITVDEVYAHLAAGEAVHTSTPSPGDYLDAFRACQADEVVCLTIGARLSGMHASARIAAGLLRESADPRRVEVVDTGTAAAGFGLVARAAGLLVAAGATCDEVVDRVVQATREVAMIGSLRTLGYLARSGRVPRLVAGLGDWVGVRPIFELSRGDARRLQLVRGDRGVERAFVRAALHRVDPVHPVWLLVCHAGAPEPAARVRAALHGALRVGRSETVGLSPVVASYTGPGMTGFAVMPLRGAELTEVA